MTSQGRRAVLITRAEPGASATAARLTAAGFTPVMAPVLKIIARPFDADVFAGAQATLITSANAARRLSAPEAAPARGRPVAAVGAATAEAARAAGCADVVSADGDAQDLAALARARFAPQGGPLVFLRGADVAGDLAGALTAAGFAVREAVVYAAAPAEALPIAGVRALKDGLAQAVAFHSARGAAAFAALARASGLESACRALAAIAISPRTAAQARALSWRAVHVAAAPTEAALIAALEASV